MSKYELTALLRSDLRDEAKEKFLEGVEKIVKALGGSVNRVAEWGQKQLAYKIYKYREGQIIHWLLELPMGGVVQLEKKLTVEIQKKEILRYLLVRAQANGHKIAK